MSDKSQTLQKKQQKQPKSYFKEYLYNASEPSDNAMNDTPAELEVELLENSLTMRRRFRNIAQRSRNKYS